MTKRQRTKEQTTIYETLHRKTKDRATQTSLITGVNVGAREVLAVYTPYTAHVLLLNNTQLI